MAGKAHTKAKVYRRKLRDLAAEGYGFDALGNRKPLRDDRMEEGLLAGYKLGKYERRKPKK